jgi:Tol biopolymer transport system component
MRLDTGETIGFPGTLYVAPAAAPDGRRFLVADEAGVAVMRLGALEDPFLLSGTGSAPLGWSHDGTRIVTFEKNYRVKIWDGATDTRVPRIVTHGRTSAESEVSYARWNEVLAISPDGRRLATAGWRFVTLRTLSTGSEIWNAYRLEAFPAALAFSPDGEWLA